MNLGIKENLKKKTKILFYKTKRRKEQEIV